MTNSQRSSGATRRGEHRVGHDDELAWCGGGVGGGATGASGFGGDGGARSGGEGADGSGGASGASGLGGIGCIGGIGGSGAGGEPGGGAVSLGACSGPVPAPCVPKTWARALFLFSGPIPTAASVPTPAAAITASAKANAAHRRLGLAHMASSPLLWPRTEARSLSTLKFLPSHLRRRVSCQV